MKRPTQANAWVGPERNDPSTEIYWTSEIAVPQIRSLGGDTVPWHSRSIASFIAVLTTRVSDEASPVATTGINQWPRIFPGENM